MFKSPPLSSKMLPFIIFNLSNEQWKTVKFRLC
ncbi:hypothetical protein ACUXI4_002004 [Pantoea piersonii]